MKDTIIATLRLEDSGNGDSINCEDCNAPIFIGATVYFDIDMGLVCKGCADDF